MAWSARERDNPHIALFDYLQIGSRLNTVGDPDGNLEGEKVLDGEVEGE